LTLKNIIGKKNQNNNNNKNLISESAFQKWVNSVNLLELCAFFSTDRAASRRPRLQRAQIGCCSSPKSNAAAAFLTRFAGFQQTERMEQ